MVIPDEPGRLKSLGRHVRRKIADYPSNTFRKPPVLTGISSTLALRPLEIAISKESEEGSTGGSSKDIKVMVIDVPIITSLTSREETPGHSGPERRTARDVRGKLPDAGLLAAGGEGRNRPSLAFHKPLEINRLCHR
jgi:hypothetical protein